MMNRAGLSALIGGAPRRGGLAHLARGETVIPSRAMAMDPSLRQHAMSSMARQGRDPMQYTVGARNLRNPSSGLSQFADLIYTENGYVDAATGQAADFSGGNEFANSGTNYNGSANYDPVTGSVRVASFGGLSSSRGREIGDVIQFGDMTPEQQAFYSAPVGSIGAPGSTLNEMAQPFRDAQQQGITGDPSMSLNPISGFNPVYGLSGPGTPQLPQYADVQQQAGPQPTYDQWQNPGTFDAWRAGRNPQGKGVQDQLYGQAMAAGTSMGIGQQPGSPNVLGTQIPTQSSMQWGTPGTALGFATDNANSQPSILNSGYQTPAYAGGAGPGWGGQGGGIGSPGISGGGGQQQGQRRQPNLQAAFQY